MSGFAVAGASNTINDLLGRHMLTETPTSSKALEEFAAKHKLPEADINMRLGGDAVPAQAR